MLIYSIFTCSIYFHKSYAGKYSIIFIIGWSFCCINFQFLKKYLFFLRSILGDFNNISKDTGKEGIYTVFPRK